MGADVFFRQNYTTSKKADGAGGSKKFRVIKEYMQYPIIRNSAEFWGKFKKRALGKSNLRNTSKNLRNTQC